MALYLARAGRRGFLCRGRIVRYLQSLGEVFFGMCSCYEFIVI